MPNVAELEEEYPRYNDLGVDRGKYLAQDSDGDYMRFPAIGPCHSASGGVIGGHISSYDKKFENDDHVFVAEIVFDYKYAVIGDISEAYEILNRILLTKKPTSFIEKCECVMEAINEYFGDFSNISTRLSHYPDSSNLYNPGTVSSFAHQNSAMCVERAMLAQNLLLEMGINTTFKTSGFVKNGEEDMHAFNLVENGGRYFIFDATQPTLRGEIISPIVAEIPKNVYDLLILKCPSGFGISVSVSHYNPMQSKNYDVVYDAGWKVKYNASDSFNNGIRF